MQFKIRYHIRNPQPWARPFPELYAKVLEQIEWADQAGFDGVVVCEHHFVDDGFLPSLMPFCAAIAARTKRIGIGTDIFLLPLHHPVRVAEDGAVVDILSNGRFELSVAAGYRPEEFAGLGMSLSQRPGRMEEGVEIIKRCWTEEEFSFEGRYYQLKNVRMTPKPVQKPRPRIIMGASSEPAARRAARIADGIKPAGPSFWEFYYDELEKLGRPVVRKPVAQAPVYLHVTEDPERDWPLLAPHARYELQSYADWGMGASTAYGELGDDDDRLRAIYRVVTPDEAIAILREVQAIDPDETFTAFPILPGQDPDLGQRSLELLAAKVIPALRAQA